MANSRVSSGPNVARICRNSYEIEGTKKVAQGMFRKLFSKDQIDTDPQIDSLNILLPLAVETPHFLVGDIHGRHDLLTRMIEKIRTRFDGMTDHDAAKVVFFGDFVDRGEDSRAVLTDLMALDQDDAVVCLMGNHEKMLLQFMEKPAKNGRRWLRYGGLQTLASFGVRGIHERMESEDLEDAAAQFEDLLPEGMLDWIKNLKLTYQTGNLLCVHASVDPTVPIEEQSKSALLWGHPEFENTPHPSGLTIAHGHTIVAKAGKVNHRLQLDTGSYATGKLSAALVLGEDVEILQA